MNTLQERMKKYAELYSAQDNSGVDYYDFQRALEPIYTDLQATVQALEVAREAIASLMPIKTVIYAENVIDGRVVDRTTIGELYESAFEDANDAADLINQTLGKAGV